MGVFESFTEEQLAYLEAHYPYDSNESIAKVLGTTKSRVYQLAHRLHLVKDREAYSRRKSLIATELHCRITEQRCRAREIPS